MRSSKLLLCCLLMSLTSACSSDIAASLSGSSEGGKKIFVTASSYTGNLGGTSGADAKCNSDANKPSDGSNYKALIASNISGGNLARQPCVGDCVSPGTEASDWPLAASTRYVRTDGTLIGTTDQFQKFDLNAEISISSSTTDLVWTGLIPDSNYQISAYHCTNWTVTTGHGTDGNAAGTDGTYTAEFRYTLTWQLVLACTSSRKLICVEI